MDYTSQQLDAIRSIDTNLQIIACAGSGKTQVISERIVHILKTVPDIKPENIVAFTYTEKAAASLKSRVLRLCREQLPDLVGTVDMYIGTIHGWCLQTLQENIFRYQKYSVLDEVKLALFINKNYPRSGMPALNMACYSDTKFFIQLLSILRESELAVPFSDLPENIRSAYGQFSQLMEDNAFFDFTMIMDSLLQSLEIEPDFSNRLSAKIKYLIVDEYQDVNPIQEKIIKSIYNLGANICVVGDDDQTIYQWRGSDITQILNFSNYYDNVKQVMLVDNFRSSEAIIDLSTTSIRFNSNRMDKQMVSRSIHNYDLDDVLYSTHPSVEAENEFIASQIESLIGVEFPEGDVSRGLAYSDFAVLLRTWSKAGALVEALSARNIPFVVSGVNQLLLQPEVRASILIFNYLYNSVDSSALWSAWSALIPSLSRSAFDSALQFLETHRPSNIKYYGTFILQEIFQVFLEKACITEESFIDSTLPNNPSSDVGEIAFYNLGMFSKVIDDFETVYFKTAPTNKLYNFLQFLRYSGNTYPEGWLNSHFKSANAVQIMTIHQAKGLEFPVVFIPGMNRNYLPIQKFGGPKVWDFLDRTFVQNVERYDTSIEDERRLLYVALTRSQKYLFISRAPDGSRQSRESQFYGELRHSSFLYTNPAPNYSSRPRCAPAPKKEIISLQLNFSILKDYFECPYRFKLSTMYGFIQPLSTRLGYGRSMHNILMELHSRALAGEQISPSLIPGLLETHVHMPYSDLSILADAKQKIASNTASYIMRTADDFQHITYVEKNIQIDMGDGILVDGRIDLIKQKDLSGREYTTIIDFKSTESAQSSYLNNQQLNLYAVGYKQMTGTDADFLEIYNMENGTPERVRVNNAHTAALQHDVLHAAASIRSNDFSKKTSPSNCSSCIFSKICSKS